MIKRALFFFGAAVFLSCANQGFPPGGPEDKTPAHIVYVYPPGDTTNVPLDTQIIIEFSEPVSPRSCEEALFITPFPGENVTYKWKGDRRLTISFAEPLLEERTYIVSIGAGTKDRRNNTMEQSFTLAFSTGDVLDRGSLRGSVYGDKVEGTQIWAYDLNETDEPNPAEDFPLYVTQAGKNGKWALTNLALSSYRLFAVMDRDVNTKYNVEYDLLGVASRDVSLDSLNSSIDMLNFCIALEDTTPPMLADAVAVDERHVDLRFSEAMRPDSLADAGNYTITHNMDTLAVHDASLDLHNAAVVHLTTAEQDSSKIYTVTVKKGLDPSFLPLLADSSHALFKGSAMPDTTRPRYLAMQPRDSSNFVLLNAPLQLVFSKAMTPERIEKHLVIADTLGDTIPGTVTWTSLTRFRFSPDRAYKPETLYLVTLPVDSIVDLSGNALADTLFQRRFTTINPDTLSAIAGSVSDADTTARGPFFLTARLINTKEEKLYPLKIETTGAYEFKEIMPGRYTLELFRDEDKNGRFSPGNAFPFHGQARVKTFFSPNDKARTHRPGFH